MKKVGKELISEEGLELDKNKVTIASHSPKKSFTDRYMMLQKVTKAQNKLCV